MTKNQLKKASEHWNKLYAESCELKYEIEVTEDGTYKDILLERYYKVVRNWIAIEDFMNDIGYKCEATGKRNIFEFIKK